MASLFFIINDHIPEIYLSFAIISLLLYIAFLSRDKKNKYYICIDEIQKITLIILIFLFFIYLLCYNEKSLDLAKVIILLIAVSVNIIIHPALKIQRINYPEFFILFLLVVLSLLLMIESGNLLQFYLTMEMQALCYYIMASLLRDNIASIEAGLKYFILGSLMSAIYLLGVALIYGVLGTINLDEMDIVFYSLDNCISIIIVLVGILLIIGTLLFKVGSFPFHFWVPDVYEGAPLATTIIFSILPKFPFFYFFIKWNNAISFTIDNFTDYFLVAGILTTIIGTIYSFKQWKFKRFIIFSSIGQIGFIVSILSINNYYGYMSVYNFLFLYILGSILIWGVYVRIMYTAKTINLFKKNNMLPTLYISDFMYTSTERPIYFVIFTFTFFNMAAIPPLPGFFQKIYILNTLTNESYFIVAAIYLVLGALSAFYYIRLVKVAFFDKKNKFFKAFSMLKNPFFLIKGRTKDLVLLDILLVITFCSFVYLSLDNTLLIYICNILADINK